MIIILYNLLVKITIVPILIFFFFFHESTVPAAWLTLQTQKGTRVICHLQQKGPFLKVDMSFPSVYLFIYYYYYFWCMHFISKMSLCKRSLSVGLVALDIFQSKKPTLKQSRVDLNGSLENPSLHIGLPIWRQK